MEGIAGLLNRIPLLKARTAVRNEEVVEREELLYEIKETTGRIAAIRSCFDLETNFDLIDSYIMEMDALEKRYAYLIKKAKIRHIAAF